MKNISILALLLFTNFITAQTVEPMVISMEATQNDENQIYNTAGIEVKPEYPGGMENFFKFVSTNFVIPKELTQNGKIFLTFVIEKDGSLSDIKVIRDIGYATAQEAIRVLKLSEKWIPGQQNGKNVRTQYSLPINLVVK